MLTLTRTTGIALSFGSIAMGSVLMLGDPTTLLLRAQLDPGACLPTQLEASARFLGGIDAAFECNAQGMITTLRADGRGYVVLGTGLEQLSALESLDLSYNHLVSFPFASLPASVRALDLSQNALTGTVPIRSSIAFRAGGNCLSGLPGQRDTGACVAETGQVATPEILVDGALFTIRTTPSDARVHYTLDGSAPTEESPVASGPIAITGTQTVRARAWAAGLAPSAIASRTVASTTPESPALAAPTFVPTPGSFNGSIVIFVSGPADAHVVATTNGATPRCSAAAPIGVTTVTITDTAVVRAIACSDAAVSDIIAGVYTRGSVSELLWKAPRETPPPSAQPSSVPEPPSSVSELPSSFSQPPSSISEPPSSVSEPPSSVPELPSSVSEPPSSASEPPSSVSEPPSSVSEPPSSVPELPSSVPPPPREKTGAPIFDPPSGKFDKHVTVTITSPTPGAMVFYLLAGNPTCDGNGIAASDPITFEETTTIRAIACAPEMDPSSVAHANYTVKKK